MVNRVDGLGRKLVGVFHFERSARSVAQSVAQKGNTNASKAGRDAESAKRYIGRHIDVPWSGWGWSESRYSRGMVFSYYPQSHSFVVVFPDSDQIDDIGISWP